MYHQITNEFAIDDGGKYENSIKLLTMEIQNKSKIKRKSNPRKND